MKRDYKEAIRLAVHGLCAGDESSMTEALEKILECLDHNIAELYHDDMESALREVGEPITYADIEEDDDAGEELEELYMDD